MKTLIKQDVSNGSLLEETLIKYGIFKIDSYLSKQELSLLNEEVQKYHDSISKSYQFGTIYSIGLNKIDYESQHYKTFSRLWMKELFLNLNSNIEKGFFTYIYSTHDFKYDGSIGRNGYLHFDRNRSLKFFFYLNDVTEQNAAFYIQEDSHLLGKKLREKAWRKLIPTPNDNFIKKGVFKIFGKPFEKVKNRIELDYPESLIPEKLIPVEGKAGTLIVFDSDIFHKGGLIRKEGLERTVLRMHSYLS